MTFKTQAEAARFDLALPSKWLFSNYTHVLESGKIWLGYLNSIIITIPVTVISVFLGAIAGIGHFQTEMTIIAGNLLFYLWSYIDLTDCIYFLFVAIFTYIWYFFLCNLYLYFIADSFYCYDIL